MIVFAFSPLQTLKRDVLVEGKVCLNSHEPPECRNNLRVYERTDEAYKETLFKKVWEAAGKACDPYEFGKIKVLIELRQYMQARCFITPSRKIYNETITLVPGHSETRACRKEFPSFNITPTSCKNMDSRKSREHRR